MLSSDGIWWTNISSWLTGFAYGTPFAGRQPAANTMPLANNPFVQKSKILRLTSLVNADRICVSP